MDSLSNLFIFEVFHTYQHLMLPKLGTVHVKVAGPDSKVMLLRLWASAGGSDRRGCSSRDG